MTTDSGDDPIARLELIEKLDPTEDPERVFDPSYRTIGGQPLTEEQGDLLLACTVEDLNAVTDSLNARSAHLNEQADLLNELAGTIRELTAVAAPFDQGDGIESAVIRMPPENRRQVRRLQNRIAELERRRATEFPD